MTFITVEGLDGAGSTTLVDAIGGTFPDATTTAEPTEDWTGQQVRRCLSDESTEPLTDFYFFIGDRVQHIEQTIRPIDQRGDLVVSDRYTDSTRAYQPVALAQSDYFDSQTEAKLFIEEAMAPWSYEPDATIYLDVSVDTALKRSARDEKYENREYLECVRDNYRALVANEADRFIVIDAEQPAREVAEEAITKLDERVSAT